jgi:hypothetical protein
MGLNVKVEYQQKDPSKPIVFLFRYFWDMTTLKKWAMEKENQWMLEGPLFLTQKGIEVCIIPGKINSPSFTIEEGNGQRITLDLDKHEELFRVHREVVHGKEWVIALDR